MSDNLAAGQIKRESIELLQASLSLSMLTGDRIELCKVCVACRFARPRFRRNCCGRGQAQ